MTDIRIYCDHDTHAPRVVEIDRLRQNSAGCWDESPDMLAPRIMSGGSGERWVPRSSLQIMDGYARWDFRCALNDRHNFQRRQDELFPVLDKFAAAGMTNLSLRLLSATL